MQTGKLYKIKQVFQEDNYMNKEKFAVSKEEFEKFISEYPNKLEIDYFMDWYSYNDFSLNGGCVWPESMVAMKSDGLYDQPIEYKILLEEYWENRDIENLIDWREK